jgi:predicted nucleic acid-binding protein
MFLLDVNALIALGFEAHAFHRRVVNWRRTLGNPVLATCSIVELGFVRVLAQAPAYSLNVHQAQDLLVKLKSSPANPFAFIPDDIDLSRLPGWARSPGQLTDAHLMELAESHGYMLATLDTRIAGAYLIPV